MLESLKQQVLEANCSLVKYNLVTLTWGNVSGIDRTSNMIVIKPSGVEYDKMTIDSMVVTGINGEIIEGTFKPSSDLKTHIELYKAFPQISGITHTHSLYATIFAQAKKEVPCFGTTHADTFNGPVPVTRMITKDEVNSGYELNTGKLIIERFAGIDPLGIPAVLVAGHAPFTWGKDPDDSVKNSLILERVAQMALYTIQLNENIESLPHYVLSKHYERKHGPNAYYGQKNS